ncbi:hypothetical protein CXB51_033781 [Gossypium anomalum]|uniref:Uncharacterized protein n=1 Tax=Gossypium anomalum TaxID=47600 RepID=A0A8J6CGC3_9ROSI|nr:hypothetical protein CXB51_033781 [Gossypium anomalum]
MPCTRVIGASAPSPLTPNYGVRPGTCSVWTMTWRWSGARCRESSDVRCLGTASIANDGS